SQAQIVFAAGSAASLSQCADGPGLTAALQLNATCTALTNGGWVSGNVNGSKATYFEGDSLPYQMLMTNLAKGTHTLIIDWDTTKTGLHALDSITSFNRTVGQADPCAGSGLAGCNKLTPTSTFPIPIDPHVSGAGVTQLSGQIGSAHV